MPLEPPATIAVLGATPLGIEAALYGRFLGYRVEIFDREDSLALLRSRGGEPLPGTAAEHTTPLGLAALAAQDGAYHAPAATTSWTRQQWADLYLGPLLKTDLLADSLRPRRELASIRREDAAAVPESPADSAAAEDEDEMPIPGLLLAFHDEERAESHLRSDAIIDALPEASSLCSALLPDPHVVVLGPSSSGGPVSFAAGMMQIREFFAELYARSDLDLYARLRLR